MSNFFLTHIEARARLRSALHIGAGNQALGGREILLARSGSDDLPYLPGSSVKGRMRFLMAAFLPRDAGSGDYATALFGAPGVRGVLSFWDCPLDKAWAEEREGTTLPAVTLRSETEATGHGVRPRLREVVTSDAPFHFRVTLASRRADWLDLLLAGMKLLEWEGLGAGTSRGMGRLRFEELRIDGRDAQARFDAIGRDPTEEPGGLAAD